MEKFGIIVNHLGPCQVSYQLIKTINEYLEKHDDVDSVLFYHNLTPTVAKPNFAVANLFEAYAYNGRLISTDLNNASRSLDYIGTKQKYFYPIDLEWTKLQNRQYEQLSQIYCNEKLPIIARSENFKQIFEKTWGSKVIGVVENFNFGQLVKVILDYESKTSK